MSRLEIFEGLDEASRRHEKEIVVEYGPDRFLHFLGVYFIVLLAIIAKFDEITGPKVSCYGTEKEKYGRPFISYANVYCWESLDIEAPRNNSSNNTTCANLASEDSLIGRNVVHNRVFIKSFIQWLPYGMLVEAFLLALPSAWWHFRLGARLMGHMKFVQILLKDIYESVKDLPAGIYRGVGKGEALFHAPPGTKKSRCPSSCANDDLSAAEKGEARLEHADENDYLKSDREMFSSLCDENFASFMHQPYLASVFRLTLSPDPSVSRAIGQEQPLKSTVLSHLCHEKNFGGKIMAYSYEKKCLIGIAVSFVALSGLAVVTCLVGRNGWTSGIFLCDVIYHEDACLLCTVPGMNSSVGFLFVNLVVTAIYLAVTLWRLLTFSGAHSPMNDGFLKSLSDENSVALSAAFKIKND